MFKYLIFIILLISSSTIHSQILINEICAVNYDSIIDEDFDRSDWIELYNNGNNAVNLKGWRISDKINFENGWEFPNVIIQAKSKLLVYASGKNFHSSKKFIMEAAGNGLFPHAYPDSYRFNYIELSGDFEFSVRLHSLSNIGVFGSAGVIIREDLTGTNRFFGVQGQRSDRYVCEFTFRDTSNRYPTRVYSKIENIYPDLCLKISRKDDSLIAGIYDYEGYCLESFSKYMEFPNKVYVGLTLASTAPEILGKASFSTLKINGENGDFSNLTGLDTEMLIPGKSYFSNELHTDFSLSRDGERIILWDNTGRIIDNIQYPELLVDMSYCRKIDGDKNWAFSQPPTPNASNNNIKTGILKEPEFTLKSGFYQDVQSTRINNKSINSKIYYTTDGSEPTISSKIYNGEEIFINETTVIKAISVLDTWITSPIKAETYFVNENTVGMPVISISSNPEYFFDKEIGLFEKIFENFEYPGEFQYFDNLGELKSQNRVGLKIHGNSSLQLPQKSLRLHSRSKFGDKEIYFPFFENSLFTNQDKLILRNGGQDWWWTFIRDSYLNKVAKNITNLETTASLPVLVYLNGDFWGLYNVRERADKEFLEQLYKINKKSVSIVESPLIILKGAANSYIQLMNNFFDRNLSEENVYSVLDSNIDIDNLIKYSTFTFYANNGDWPNLNLKFWRSTELDSKWKWFIYDMDITLGCAIGVHYNESVFHKVMDSSMSNSMDWQFAKLLNTSFQSTKFKNSFLLTTCDLLNSILNFENMNRVLDSTIELSKNAIPIQQNRWEGSLVNYEKNVDIIREFIKQRPNHYREHLRSYFDISGISKITLTSSQEKACTFNINSLNGLINNWEGHYFNDIPINISMNIRNGFNFMYWLINDTDTLFTNEISIILTDSTTIQAVFEDIIEPVEAFVVINEIMYKPSSNMDSGDWIELHNPGDFKIDISSYVLKDDNNERDFAIPNGTFLESKEYLVLSGNLKDFRKVYPDVNNYLGEFDYGFGTDDMVRLYDKSRNIVDSVSYMNKAPWYPQADGGGPSLELIIAFLDNSLAQNWKVSSNNGGSPGKPNSVTSVNSSEFFSQIKIYPNPAVSYTNIEFELEFDSYIVVNISDIFGNEIVKLLDGNYQKGKYLTYWNGKNFENIDMQSGIYFINIKTEQNTIRGKLILN